MPELYLGIDTSNYKTSLAVIDESGSIVFEKSELLDVKEGSRGLRQSDAFFQQSNRLPSYFDELFKTVDSDAIKAVGVSVSPRRVEGSYMPCFLAGKNAAHITATALGIPVFEFSHQEGHAAAILYDEELSYDNSKSLFFHLSGGTTEFLLCEPDENGFKTEIIGGTKDISIGQLIDRIGVKLGYSFPAGPYLDEIADNYSSGKIIPDIEIKDGYFNLSGIETKLLRYIEESNNDINPVIAELFDKLALIIFESACYLSEKYSVNNVYIAGGVASSKSIRSRILLCKSDKIGRCSINHVPQIIFGKAKYSGDNAVGIARLTQLKYL